MNQMIHRVANPRNIEGVKCIFQDPGGGGEFLSFFHFWSMKMPKTSFSKTKTLIKDNF